MEMLVIDEVGPVMVPVVALVREMRRDRCAGWWLAFCGRVVHGVGCLKARRIRRTAQGRSR
ncbi:pollen-specific leucine-rich repeat extensin-like protein 3 [Iris pallida]|uniref:Pollen-specific leucine-rich repeat extensin-like protein 3 n=1 Tax=Iris pallida TaxID=29817 RepID=A0AAX6G165_IRIPA|nr:pollen-specific leucine-rich repeat extensin-like protein 3 [Iris pallida]KAJ6829441.1 pollen-specific leucine-rich repeat extensin-like protein 3 [Iris pallida]